MVDYDLEDYQETEKTTLETKKNDRTFLYEIRLLQNEYTNELIVQRRWGYITQNLVWRDNNTISRAKADVHQPDAIEFYNNKIADKLRHGYTQASHKTRELLSTIQKERGHQ